jgi:hypothetical protein
MLAFRSKQEKQVKKTKTHHDLHQVEAEEDQLIW